jgi:hypothetical protein
MTLERIVALLGAGQSEDGAANNHETSRSLSIGTVNRQLQEMIVEAGRDKKKLRRRHGTQAKHG